MLHLTTPNIHSYINTSSAPFASSSIFENYDKENLPAPDCPGRIQTQNLETNTDTL